MDKRLKDYIDNKIKPMYRTFDKGHDVSHFNFVTKNCIKYAKELNEKIGYGIDLDIAYIVDAYHDIGISCGREGHALSSGRMVREDGYLALFYDEQTIEMIAQACEDHSSHLDHEPRSIYGKIVADADRNNTVYLVFSRPIKYGLKNESYLDREGHINRVYEFANNKFGRNGYVRYWLDIAETRKEQQKLWDLLDHEEACKQYIAGIYDEITKGKG